MARVGGTLEITCTEYGTTEPVLVFLNEGNFQQVDREDMDDKGDGKFLFKINSEFASKYRKNEFACACGGNAGLHPLSSDRVDVREVLCRPQDTVCPDGAGHCWLQADGTGKCGGSGTICVKGKETPPVTAFQMVVQSKTVMSMKKSCEALTEENIEKWGQVELKEGSLSESTFSKGSYT